MQNYQKDSEYKPKKLLILNILEILRKYTDENHRLGQKEIIDILKKEYDMSVDRKAIKRNIMDLIDAGYDIEYTETVRMTPNKKTGEMEESYVWSDFYYENEFSNSELRMLIDSLVFSRHIPYSQRKELVEKLEKLSSVYFKPSIKHIVTATDYNLDNKELFYTIDILDEAITAKKKVSFNYYEYGTDKKLHCRKTSDGTVREYKINPYQMVAKEGKYYLICNNDKYMDVSNYRVDRIANIKILDEDVKPFKSLRGANGQPLDLQKYMDEHVYMYASDTVKAKFRVSKALLSDVVDMFEKNLKFSDESSAYVTVNANVNEISMFQFAKNYSNDVVVLEPKSLIEKLKEDAKQTLNIYSDVKL